MLDPEIKRLLSEYFDGGEDWEALAKKGEIPKEVSANIKEALQLVSEYVPDFPDNLRNAVKVLSKYAIGYGYGYGYLRK